MSLGVVIGTGPSLRSQMRQVRDLGRRGAVLFGVNNTFRDFNLDHWIACDPDWHREFGIVTGRFTKWHWDQAIAQRGGYLHIPGRWYDGVSPPGSNWLSLNHGSGPQALNLATSIVQCDPILLVGHDMTYRPGEPRHYFDDLSDVPGEYPKRLRKTSPFEKPKREGGAHPDGDGILFNYKHIAEQAERGEIPRILNATPGSAMTWFPMVDLDDFT